MAIFKAVGSRGTTTGDIVVAAAGHDAVALQTTDLLGSYVRKVIAPSVEAHMVGHCTPDEGAGSTTFSTTHSSSFTVGSVALSVTITLTAKTTNPYHPQDVTPQLVSTAQMLLLIAEHHVMHLLELCTCPELHRDLWDHLVGRSEITASTLEQLTLLCCPETRNAALDALFIGGVAELLGLKHRPRP